MLIISDIKSKDANINMSDDSKLITDNSVDSESKGDKDNVKGEDVLDKNDNDKLGAEKKNVNGSQIDDNIVSGAQKDDTISGVQKGDNIVSGDQKDNNIVSVDQNYSNMLLLGAQATETLDNKEGDKPEEENEKVKTPEKSDKDNKLTEDKSDKDETTPDDKKDKKESTKVNVLKSTSC